ncbi:putative cytochrome c oxidase subunit 5C-4 [Cucurbita maxima]|uniref:Cytochrome c oxidase subunit 5C-4 n=1 Tax=Cucurbita maxima TaxID=3661 RepID=A0A6J1IZ83_CUCMA|nr:putative cytochrome c oxidase subunit 5C-4 [Cucurbita maxima]XP_022983412.1 putative cytochrome c oxidase subunit 5C-4 [Cucurbita maxima]
MVGNVVYKGPSAIKEIIYGVGVGLMAGGLWKMHHWNYQRRTKEFYELLDRGDITVVLPEDN